VKVGNAWSKGKYRGALQGGKIIRDLDLFSGEKGMKLQGLLLALQYIPLYSLNHFKPEHVRPLKSPDMFFCYLISIRLTIGIALLAGEISFCKMNQRLK
jgi:hypothetical protein